MLKRIETNEIQFIKAVARKTKIAPAKYEKAPNKQMKEEDEIFKIVKAIQRNKKTRKTHPLRETDHE